MAEIQRPPQSTLRYKSLQHITELQVTKRKARRRGSSRLLQLANETQSQKGTPKLISEYRKKAEEANASFEKVVEDKQKAHEARELHYTLKDPSFLSTISAACTLPNKMGIDICYIPRVAEILADKQTHFKFWCRVLNPLETALYKVPPHKKTGFLAGRWAAKEAIIKAWGAQEDEKKIFMQDIIILTPKLCRTIMVTNGNAGSFHVSKEGQAQELKQDQGRQLEGGKTVGDVDKEGSEGDVTESGPPRAFVRKPDGTGWKELSISISHDADYAMAVALVTP